MKIQPWGALGWLFRRMNVEKWHIVLASSFEDRSAAVVEWMIENGSSVHSSCVFRIENPPSRHWDVAKAKVEQSFSALELLLAGRHFGVISLDLMSFASAAISSETINANGSDSVLLDISTLPKKFFMFALKVLIADKRIRNIVVAYSRAANYPEVALCEDALPPSAMQGFGRIEPSRDGSRLIVGVGYMALSVEQILERAKNSKLDFILPFPPASPAFRRNWALLSMLMPEELPRNTEIHRIDSMDAFEVFNRIMSWGEGVDLDIIPLGPKPHALGMAMAVLRLGGHAELIYSQPRSYLANYSEGVSLDMDGKASVFGYCLKYDGRLTF